MDQLLVDREGGACILTLNRPDEGNSLTNALTLQLADELANADQDPGIRAVVLTGAGETFCLGLDQTEVASWDYQYPLFVDAQRSPWKVLYEMNTPVIGAINGPALNSGLGLALMCSFLIASENATFGENYATVQHTHPMGGLVSLYARGIGVRRARELSFFGEELGVMEAYERNLVNHVVAQAELLPYARARAQQLARSDHKTVALMSGLYRRAELETLSSTMASEERGFRVRELDIDNVRARLRERIWAGWSPSQSWAARLTDDDETSGTPPTTG